MLLSRVLRLSAQRALCRLLGRRFRSCLLAGLAVAAPPAHALLRFDEVNQVNIRLTSSVAWDSNLTAQSNGIEDYTFSAGLGLDFARHAGLLSLDVSADVTASHYQTHSGMDTTDPRFSLTISKGTGRLTGGLNMGISRSAVADPTVNLRTTSWSTPLSLHLHYPINSRYSLNSDTAMAQRNYTGTDALANYADLSEALSLAYALTSKLDMTATCRARFSSTSYQTRDQDYATTVGFTGSVGPKLHGSLSAGYQTRTTTLGGKTYAGMNANADLTWNPWRAVTVTGQLSRDFSTTARAASTDSLTAGLSTDLALGRKFTVGAGITGANTRFLDGGLLLAGRQDRTLGENAHVGYRLTEHLSLSLAAMTSRTRSNSAGFSRVQRGWSLSATSQW